MTFTNDSESNNDDDNNNNNNPNPYNNNNNNNNINNNNSLQQLQRQSSNPRYMAPTASSLAAVGPSTAAPPPAKFKSSNSKRSRNALSNSKHVRDAKQQTKYARVVEATTVGESITDTDADRQWLSEMEELLKILDSDNSSVESTKMMSAHGPVSTDAVDGPAAKTTFWGSLKEYHTNATLNRDAEERLQKAKENYLLVKMSVEGKESDMMEFTKSISDIQCYGQKCEELVTSRPAMAENILALRYKKNSSSEEQLEHDCSTKAEKKAREEQANKIALAAELNCQPKNRGENARQLREQENMMKQIRLLNEEDQNKDDDMIAGSELKSMLGASKEEEEIRQLKKEIDNLRNAGIAHEDKIHELEAIIVQSVLERKQMHNTIQELRGNVRVFARIRLILPQDGEQGIDGKTPSVSHFGDEQVAVANLNNPSQRHEFSFDRVFAPSAGQEDVFSEVSELVQSALDGYNVCIFSYGQTGSGKSHTMQGAGSGDMRGLIPRCLEQIGLHKITEEKDGWEFIMEVSFLEIYNESLKDLLRADVSQECWHKIKVGCDGRRTVADLTVKVIDPNDQAAVDDILALAAKRRATGSTDMNTTSSRSHSVFTLNITARHVERNQVVRGTLNLVDLAGSERLDRSNATGQRQKESVAINKSLSALVDVFTAIGKKSSHIPFRHSKLTFLLQPALSGDGKMCMIVNLSPTLASVPETLSSLRFASTVKNCELGKAKRRIEDLHSETTDSKKNAGEGLEANNWVMKLLRPLTFQEQTIVSKATQGIGPLNEILASHDRDSVQRSSMQTLNPGQWLNDEIINYFLKKCLAKRDEKLCANQPGRKRSHFFNTFFVETMFDETNKNLDLQGKYNYKNVERWSKKVPGEDIFKLKYILCPINHGNMHWTCAVIFMEEKRIQYYDSLGGTDMFKLKGLLQYVKDEYKAKNGKEMDASEWKLVQCTSDTPQQKNGYDCGVFTCMFCDFISKDCPLVFNQEYIDQCRDRIALSIMKNCAIE